MEKRGINSVWARQKIEEKYKAPYGKIYLPFMRHALNCNLLLTKITLVKLTCHGQDK